jgi:hypothetical protein
MEQGGASVRMQWNGGSTAVISGFLQHNVDGDLWGVSYNISGVTALSAAAGGGFTATAGTGSVWDLNSTATHALNGKQDNSGSAFYFAGDGHRLAGDDDTGVGRGWINNDGTNDFLFTATPVPEPATLTLLGLGLAGSVARRIRRRKN